MLRLYDTALETVSELELREPGKVSMYVCGPTVYSDPHIGHGRLVLVWDIVRRYLRWSGLKVRFVSNVTDIEDKIIAKANAIGADPQEVASRFEVRWFETMDRLGVERPDDTPHATAYVADMISLIERLIASGAAYVGGDGVYFSVSSVKDYGLLAHQSVSSLRAGARVEADEEAGKRSPVDFVLWKFAKEGEPSWSSPWGEGRPGWHTECVAMSLDLLGEDFDLHAGGNDLVFPHHENERAQALAAGSRFSRRWAHSGMVQAGGGEKMSKSLGNVLSLPEILDAYDPRALRLLMLQSHYRAPVEVTDDNLRAAAAAVRRLDAFGREFAPARGHKPDPAVIAQFKEKMDDDLRSTEAVGLLFDTLSQARAAGSGTAARAAGSGTAARAAGSGEQARAAGSGAGAGAALAAAVFELAENALGLPIHSEAEEIPAEVQQKVEARDLARKSKDFATSDKIRDELESEGWIVEDTAQGTKIHK